MFQKKYLAIVGIVVVLVIGAIIINSSGVLRKQESKTESKSNSSMTQDNETTTPKIQKLSNGLIIEDIEVGGGSLIKKGDTVSINYTGTFENGTKFDSSIDRNQKLVIPIGVGRVIPGWDIGIPEGNVDGTEVIGMKEGGKRKLTIPSSLGYGDSGVPGIPGGSTLIFLVEDPQIVK